MSQNNTKPQRQNKDTWTNKNAVLPDTSLANVFMEFYRLKNGLENNPNDLTYTDNATIMLVSIVENACRVKMAMLAERDLNQNKKKISLSIPLLVDVVRDSDTGWTLDDQDYEEVVNNTLARMGCELKRDRVNMCDRVSMRDDDIELFVNKACPRPKPYIKNRILASSSPPFQKVLHVTREFGDGILDSTGYSKSDYKEMFDARHMLVHSLMRDPNSRNSVQKWVKMVEKFLKKLLCGSNNEFNWHKGAALVDIDPEMALKHLNAAASLPHTNLWLLFYIAIAHIKLGHKQDAVEALQKVVYGVNCLLKEVEDGRAHKNMVVSMLKYDLAVLCISIAVDVERYGYEAAAFLDSAVSIAGLEYPDVCIWAAWYHEGSSRYIEAIDCLNVALHRKDTAADKLAQVYHDKGLILQLLGQDNKAKKCFERASELDPTNEVTRRHISG